MEKLKKLVLLKQKRDRIDCVGIPIAAAVRQHEASSLLPAFPFFFISSAAAASVDNISETWRNVGSIRLVLITAATLPLPASTPCPLPTDPSCARKLLADAIVLESPETVPIDPEMITSWLDCIAKREALFEESLQLQPPSNCDDAIVVPVYFLRIPMQDNGSQRLSEVMRGITAFIDGCCARSEGSLGNVLSKNARALRATCWPATMAIDGNGDDDEEQVGMLVHCLQGISRSVSVVIWYLVETLSTLPNPPTVDDVLRWVRSERRCACPNLCFAAELFSMEKRLHKNRL
ncbi:dual specificity protein phosphatase, putative [Bodo saltans]|uniref:protein-tyrosine-phosphatase n=1 Tax=Bodo saltans TaxID=75058 RepID=A0A0S4KI74_BODSA|nr:dual specificity protein phosphatase, putative [Bodo saltans]|eukprot:CUI14137.1 dual specificity protein phosphatase, putative [Bodo saltans]